MRRARLVLLVLVLGLTTAGCGGLGGGGGAATNAGGNGGGNGANNGGGGSGSASATVTVKGTPFTLTGGTCEQVGVLGYQVTIGDYQNGQAGKGDFLSLIVGTKLSTAEGRNGGTYWTLATDQQGSIGADRHGSFSGTDVISGTKITGTFACA